MYIPTVDHAAVLEDIVMRMLCGGKAGVVGKYPQTVADLQAVKDRSIARLDLTVFLRHSGDAHAGLISIDVQHVPVTA